ncbi:hypothetical protein B0T17DRAFT_480522 [Bombardia bombarda]|uniref:tRNA(Ile)-lysidine synthetase n=1 Tax=Bombardia bombarda TaxID=252184 RepID=A0AA40CDE8_9PEZI|nr:hypothetical protein B0T17DRAFT_480522 [Bombardia bombarda]
MGTPITVTTRIFHRTARAVSNDEFVAAVQAVAVPRFPRARPHIMRGVGLAISGGVDSMALAFLCNRAKLRDPWLRISDNLIQYFICLVVDHRLREGSTEEAKNVVRVLKERIGLKAEVLGISWDEFVGKDNAISPKDLPNLETAARQLRYRSLGNGCRRWDMASLFAAHHQDDQYETVLMRLLSGHGYRGLRGMRAATDIPECYDLHGLYQSGFVDDQLRRSPFYNMNPTRHQQRHMRRNLRDDIDYHLLQTEMYRGLRSNTQPFFDEYDEIARGSKRAPPLQPLDVEDGGIQIYRPLLHFGKDRLIATCLENDIPWFEDHTNTDQTLTLRNAVRYMSRNHDLPVALQKPAILRLAEVCENKVAREEAAAERFMDRVVIHNIELNAGTAVVEVPSMPLPRFPTHSAASPARRQKRLEQYRRIAALMIRKLIAIVTPEREITPVGNLDYLVSLLFPSLIGDDMDPTRPTHRGPPKAYVICGVHFIPLIGDFPIRWLISRAPHASNVKRPTQYFHPLHTRLRSRHRYSNRWKFPAGWSPWLLFDGRYWVRIKSRLPTGVCVEPFEPEHQKGFREGLGDDGARNELALKLKRYAPGKVRYTLPAIYALFDVSYLLQGENHFERMVRMLAEEEASVVVGEMGG